MIPALGVVNQAVLNNNLEKGTARWNAEFAKYQLERNEALQREFAQQGLRWKVEDAKAAGVHPLAALGASTHSYSPVTVGGMSDPTPAPDIGTPLLSMGQDISRAIAASSDATTRKMQQLQIASLEEDVVHKKLQNSQLAKMNFVGPPMPTGFESGSLASQGDVKKLTTDVPLQITGRDPRARHREYGNLPDVGWARTRTGMAPVPSKDVKERIEDSIIQESLWAIRNNLVPSLGIESPPPKEHLKEFGDYDRWQYNLKMQEYQPTYNWGDRYWRIRKRYMK